MSEMTQARGHRDGRSRGLGRVIAGVLTARGIQVVIGGRDTVALEETAAALKAAGGTAVVGRGRRHECRGPCTAGRRGRELGGLDMLVNNASELGPMGPLMQLDVTRLGRVFPVNAGAPLALIQLAVPLLAEAARAHREHHQRCGSGRLSGLGAIRREQGGAGAADADARHRTAGTGVSAVIVDPGDMRTRMHQEAFPGRGHLRPPAARSDGAVLELAVRSGPRGAARRAIRGAAAGCPMAAAGVVADFALPAQLKRPNRRKRAACGATRYGCSSPTSRRDSIDARAIPDLPDGSLPATCSSSTRAER